MMNPADQAAELDAIVHPPHPVLGLHGALLLRSEFALQEVRDPPPRRGWSSWRVADGPLILVPALRPGAPFHVRRRYEAGVVANAGCCPVCSAPMHPPLVELVELVSASGRSYEAEFVLAHQPWCRVPLGPADRCWLDRAGLREFEQAERRRDRRARRGRRRAK